MRERVRRWRQRGRPAATACLLLLAGPVMAGAQDLVRAPNGDITITPLAHASVQIEYGVHVVQVDPWSVAGLAGAKPADLVLVTDADAGAHHLDRTAIAKVRKHGAPVVIPASGRAHVPDGIVLNNGEQRTFAAMRVEAIAAYDLSPGEPYHPKGEANGYVLTIGGARIYIAGVTECVPEMRSLGRLDVMFVPMNLPNGRMTPSAAAACVRALKPRVAYPYHYDQGYIRRRSDPAARTPPEILQSLDEFAALVQPDGIEVRRGAWYPAP